MTSSFQLPKKQSSKYHKAEEQREACRKGKFLPKIKQSVPVKGKRNHSFFWRSLSSQTLPLTSVPTFKNPFFGIKILAWAKPEEAIKKVRQQLKNTEDWEMNLDGLTSVLRLVHHNPEFIIMEYKTIMQLVLKQVKNLRSQVARAAVHLVGDMFATLKRSMESDLEKIALPLVMKTGETNRFLREDCNQALDKMIENVSPSKSILIITAEPLNSKNAGE